MGIYSDNVTNITSCTKGRYTHIIMDMHGCFFLFSVAKSKSQTISNGPVS